MNFHRRRHAEEPEINLIPFIDVLLVVLIFLMLTTTYAKYTQLKITLPVAESNRIESQPREIVVGVSSDGHYTIDRQPVEGVGIEALTAALNAASQGDVNRVVIVSADAMAAHQSVINVMDAARRAGLVQLTFATQSARSAGSGR